MRVPSGATRIKAPLFVVHGRNDPRVPYTEAEQIVTAARKNVVFAVKRVSRRLGYQQEGEQLHAAPLEAPGRSSPALQRRG